MFQLLAVEDDMTPEAWVEGGSLVLSALLGGAGWAALRAWWVRARVRFAVRSDNTVHVLRQTDRDEIEKALEANGIPNGFLEAELWNVGRRASKPLLLDIALDQPISSWGVSSPQEHIEAPWRVKLDPADASSRGLRLEVTTLRPGARITVWLGATVPKAEAPTAKVSVYEGNRTLREYIQSRAVTWSMLPFVIASLLLLVWGWVETARECAPVGHDRKVSHIALILSPLFVLFAGLLVMIPMARSGPSWFIAQERARRRDGGSSKA